MRKGSIVVESHKLEEDNSLLFNGVVLGNVCLKELCQEVERHAVCRGEHTQQVEQQLNVIRSVPGWRKVQVSVRA